MEADCRSLLPFLAGELNEKESESFIKHLKRCKTCSEEYEEMNHSWNAIQMDFEEKEVPYSLKNEVMDYVFETDRNRSPVKRSKPWFSSLKEQFTPLASGLLIVLAAINLYLILHTYSFYSGDSQLDPPAPTKITNTLTVKAADLTNDQLTGLAAVIKEGKTEKLIVQMDNLPQLKDQEVYQVWLLKDGERENAGIFTPNENGTGILSFPLSESDQFDQIGITAEPDGTSVQPRGKKIAGTG